METIPMADSMFQSTSRSSKLPIVFLQLDINTENGFYKKSLSKNAFLRDDQGHRINDSSPLAS